MEVVLKLNFRLDVSEACKLIEMSSEGISCMINSRVSCAYEAASFNHVVTLIISGGRKVLVNWVDLEVLEWINRSNSMLPNIANYIVKISSFEHIYRVRRHPILHVDVTN